MSKVVVVAIVALFLFSFVAVTDLRQRRISNGLVLALILLGVVRLFLQLDPLAALATIGVAAAVFILAFASWLAGWFGAGDVKLMFAGALLVGSHAIIDFLFLTAMFGGVLALVVFFDMWLDRHFAWSIGIAFPRHPQVRQGGLAESARQASVPYGVAVSVGCLLTMFLTAVEG